MEKKTIERIILEEESLTWYPDGSIQVRMKNILTTEQVLFPRMLLLKSEGAHSDVVRILEIQMKDRFLYLKIEDQKTGLPYIISHKLGSEFYLWT
jgi:hypothetical protein